MKFKANPFSLSMVIRKQTDLGLEKLADLADSSVDAISKKTRYGMDKISAAINLPKSDRLIKLKSTELPNLFPVHE
ncbi:hypothetical protein [Reichenbachiella versicolor]|uniref:hypothetical protein n=1 Tax=Reichenbachiella versicolor TaxID=1821036 RepID=UPI000D6E856E|nr:hypothetical protein [Reichenbachiella versicolor]